MVERSRTFEVSGIVSLDGTDLTQFVDRGSIVTGLQPSIAVKKLMSKIFRHSEKKATSARVTLIKNSSTRGRVETTYDAS
jgi:hypothetical protein